MGLLDEAAAELEAERKAPPAGSVLDAAADEILAERRPPPTPTWFERMKAAAAPVATAVGTRLKNVLTPTAPGDVPVPRSGAVVPEPAATAPTAQPSLELTAPRGTVGEDLAELATPPIEATAPSVPSQAQMRQRPPGAALPGVIAPRGPLPGPRVPGGIRMSEAPLPPDRPAEAAAPLAEGAQPFEQEVFNALMRGLISVPKAIATTVEAAPTITRQGVTDIGKAKTFPMEGLVPTPGPTPPAETTAARREYPPVPASVDRKALAGFVKQAMSELYRGARPIDILRDDVAVQDIERRVRELYWGAGPGEAPTERSTFFQPLGPRAAEAAPAAPPPEAAPRPGVGETIEKVGRRAREFWGKQEEKFPRGRDIEGNVIDRPELLINPKWLAASIAETVPSLAAAITGAGAGTATITIAGQALRLTPQLLTRLARFGALAGGGTVGGALEGANTYEEVLRRGGTKEDAARALVFMGFAAAGLNAFSLSKILPGKEAARGIKPALKAGATEAVTEAAEEPTEALILGDPVKESLKQAATVAVPAFAIGAGAQAVSQGGRRARPAREEGRPSAPLSTDQQAFVDLIRQEVETQVREALEEQGAGRTQETPRQPPVEAPATPVEEPYTPPPARPGVEPPVRETQQPGLPGYLREGLERNNARAEQLGIADEIEELSAQRLTAKQVAARLQARVPDAADSRDVHDLVRSVRWKRGIPSMDQAGEFEAWLRTRKQKATTGAPAPAAPTSPRPQAPAPAFSATLYQGRGKTPEEIYGKTNVAAGRGHPLVGPGEYYAFDEQSAARYGTVTPQRVELRSPYILTSDRQWFDLLRAADARQLSSVDREQGPTSDAAQRLQGYLQARGHDGLIARFPSAREGDVGETGGGVKRLRESFGHPTVVMFGREPAAQAPETTPATKPPERPVTAPPPSPPAETRPAPTPAGAPPPVGVFAPRGPGEPSADPNAKGFTRTGLVDYRHLPPPEGRRSVYASGGEAGSIVGEDTDNYYVSHLAGSMARVSKYPRAFIDASDRYWRAGSRVQIGRFTDRGVERPASEAVIVEPPTLNQGFRTAMVRTDNGEEFRVPTRLFTNAPKTDQFKEAAGPAAEPAAPTAKGVPPAPPPGRPVETVPAPALGAPTKPTKPPAPVAGAELTNPRDITQLVRFVQSKGGLAPSPTGDLAGEYAEVPFLFKNRNGLSPAAMAEAVKEASGVDLADHEILRMLRDYKKLTAEQARRRAGEETATAAAETAANLGDDELIRELAQRMGISEEEARRTFEQRKTAAEFKPEEATDDERAWALELIDNLGGVEAAKAAVTRLGEGETAETPAGQVLSRADQLRILNALAPGEVRTPQPPEVSEAEPAGPAPQRGDIIQNTRTGQRLQVTSVYPDYEIWAALIDRTGQTVAGTSRSIGRWPMSDYRVEQPSKKDLRPTQEIPAPTAAPPAAPIALDRLGDAMRGAEIRGVKVGQSVTFRDEVWEHRKAGFWFHGDDVLFTQALVSHFDSMVRTAPAEPRKEPLRPVQEEVAPTAPAGFTFVETDAEGRHAYHQAFGPYQILGRDKRPGQADPRGGWELLGKKSGDPVKDAASYRSAEDAARGANEKRDRIVRRMGGADKAPEWWGRPTIPGKDIPAKDTAASAYPTAGRLRAFLEAFEARIEANDLPKDARELRKIAADAIGVSEPSLRDDAAAIDDLYDALEAALNRVYRQRRDDGASIEDQVARAVRTEAWLGNRTRTLEIAKRQQFSTPLPIAELVAYAADPIPGESVYEPTAGTGNLLAALPKDVEIRATELDPRRAETLRQQGYSVSVGDALTSPLSGNVVVMNPPWGKFSKGEYGRAVALGFTPVDMAERFVAMELHKMKPGGRLVAVLPTTVLQSGGFTNWLTANHRLRALVSMPPGAYNTRGTQVGSVLLVVDKGKGPKGETGLAEPMVRGAAQEWDDAIRLLAPFGGQGRHARGAATVRALPGQPRPAEKPREAEPAGEPRPAGLPARPPAEGPGRPGRAPAAEPGAGRPAPEPERPGAIPPAAAPVDVGAGRAGRGAEAGVPGPGAAAEPGAGQPGAGVVAPGGRGPGVEPAGAGAELLAEPGGGVPDREPAKLPARLREQRFSVADHRELEAAASSRVFAPAPLRSSPGENPHPRLIVKTRSLAGARLPELTYEPKGQLLADAYARKVISDQQLDYGILPALQANERGRGFLAADDVGVGKTRIAAGVAGEWAEAGVAKRILYATASEVNIQDVIREFNLYAGGTFPADFIQVKTLKGAKERAGKDEIEPLPVSQRPTIYLIDRFNLMAYRRALGGVGLDAIIGDEAHLLKNIGGAEVGKAWLNLEQEVLGRGGRFLYLTATPAVDFGDLHHLIGLREWTADGFTDYINRVTGNSARARGNEGELRKEFERLQTLATEALKDRPDAFRELMERVGDPSTEPMVKRVDAYRDGIARLRAEILRVGGAGADAVAVGSDAGAIGVTASGKTSFFKGGSPFGVSITPAEQEQIMRELAAKGVYDSVDLWRAGVEFEIATTPMTAEQLREYRQLVPFFHDLNDAFMKYGRLNKQKNFFTIRHFLQAEAKRRLFDYRLPEAIRVATEALDRGEQVVISTISVHAGKEDQGHIPAAINSINARELEIDEETGEVTIDREIPEALIVRAELLDRWKEFRQVPSPVDLVVNAFGKANVAVVTGDVTPKNREKMIAEFQGGQRRVALISGAGKTGISLHHVLETTGEGKGRRHMIVTDYEWSATMFKQELGRVDRSGQKSAPKITVLSTGSAGERKFLATIANRMRNLGALSKGSAESASNEQLAEFEIGGDLDTHAMRNAYVKLPGDIQDAFLASAWREYHGLVGNEPIFKNTRSYPDRASLKDFLLDLQFMNPEDADVAFTTFWEERARLIREQEESEADLAGGRTRSYRGQILRSTELTPDLILHEVKDDKGHKTGILQGLVTDNMDVIQPFLEKRKTGQVIRRYVTFAAGDDQVAGLELRPSAIAPVSRRFGQLLGGKIETAADVLEALRVGDKVPLEGEYTLRMRQDGKIAIDGATMKDRDVLLRHGAKYVPVGNYWQVGDLDALLKRFPIDRKALRAAAGPEPEAPISMARREPPEEQPELIGAVEGRPPDEPVYANEESRYAGEDLRTLLPQVELEQRERRRMIRAGEEMLAGGVSPQTGRRLTEKQVKTIKGEIAHLRQEYENTFREVVDAAGAGNADALRQRIERAVGGEASTLPGAQAGQQELLAPPTERPRPAPRPTPAARPIKEAPNARLVREKQGYKTIVPDVDAARLKDLFERQSGEVLPYKAERLASIRAREHDNSYVQVDVEAGQVHINDGRHRLAVAAERGQTMAMVVKSDEAAGELRELLRERPAPAGPTATPLRFEQTAMGPQALIPGAEAREMPQGVIRPSRPQRGTAGTPLFDQPRAGAAEQGALFMPAEQRRALERAQELQSELERRRQVERGEAYRDLLREAPFIGQLRQRMVDTSRKMTEGELQALAAAPHTQILADGLESAFRRLQDRLGRFAETFQGAYFAGLSPDQRYLGANIPGDMDALVFNPWAIAELVAFDVREGAIPPRAAARQFAEYAVATMVHELSHRASRGHDERFAGIYTRAVGRTMVEHQRAVREIVAALEADNGRSWDALLDDAVRLRRLDAERTPAPRRPDAGAAVPGGPRAGESGPPGGPGPGAESAAALPARPGEGEPPGVDFARVSRGGPGRVAPTDARILANRVELFFPPETETTEADVRALFEQAPDRVAAAAPVEGRGLRWIAHFPDRYTAVEEFDRLLTSGQLTGRRLAGETRPTRETRRPRIQAERGAAPQETAVTQPNWQPPARADGRMDLKNKYRLIRQLEQAFEIPIRTGKVRPAGARGVFKVEPEVIRLRNAANLPTALHEIGHFLRKKRLVDYAGFEEALEALAQARGLKGDKLEEGIAEFTKLYVTEPAQADSTVPGLVDRFEDGLRRRWPEGLEALVRVRQQYRDFRDAPLLARIQANTESGRSQRNAHLSARTFREWAHRFYGGIFDDLHIVKRIQAAATEGRRLAADEDAYLLARLARSPSAAEMFLKVAPVDFDTLTLREGILPFEQAIEPIWKERDQFDAYLQLRTTIDMLNSGVERLERAGQRMLAAWETNPDELGRLHTILDTPAFREAARNLDRLRDAALEYIAAAGRYSAGHIELLRRLHRHHAPLYRVFDEGPDSPLTDPAAGVGPDRFANLPSPLKRRVGSERPVISPLQSIVRNLYALVTVANRNEVMATLANHVEGTEGLGRLMERVPPDVKPTVFSLDEIRRALQEAGLDLDDADLTTLARVFRPTRSQDPNVVTIYRNGQAEEWLLDPTLAKVAASLDHWTLPWWLKFFALIKNVMRAGVVLHPQFALANVMRDQLAAAAQSKFAIPFVGYVRGLTHLVGGDEVWQRFQASGAPVFSQLLAEPEAVEHALRRQLEGFGGSLGRVREARGARALFQSLYDVVMDGYQKVGRLAEYSETPTRLGVFARRLAGPEREDVESARPTRAQALRAGFEAREASVDFARRGGWTGIRGWTAVTDFMNPALQGGDKFFRTAKNHPGRTAAVGATMMLMSLLLYLNNRDKDAYWKGTSGPERDLNFIYVPDDGSPPLKIPGPFEWMVFYAIPRRVFEWLDGREPELLRRLGETLGRVFGVNWIPTAVRPLIENFANWSLFRDRPLEPKGMERLPAGQRASRTTSEAAKRIGELLDYSPVKIDNLIRGYTGTIGEDLVKSLDALMRAEQRGALPTRRWGDLPVIRRFIGRTPNLSVETVDRFYRLLEASQQAVADRNRRRQEGRLTREFVEAHALELGVASALESTAERFADWRKQMNRIETDPKLPGDEKRRHLDQLAGQILTVAEQRLRGVDRLRQEFERRRSPAGTR